MNGWTTKIITGLLVTLLGAAALGSFTAASRLAAVEAVMGEIGSRLDRHRADLDKFDDRLRTVERRRSYPDLE